MKRTLASREVAEQSDDPKKSRGAAAADEDCGIDDGDLVAAVLCETQNAFQLVTSSFPSATVLGGSVPPLALKHQLYAVVNDRTRVDRQLLELSRNGVVQMFQLTTGANDYAVAMQSDYKRHVVQRCAVAGNNIETLLNKLLAGCGGEVTATRQLVKDKLEFSEADITLLVSAGVLVMCNVNSWYLAIPNASVFVKALTNGRRMVLQTIRKQRHHEMLESELARRNLAGVRLGMRYHIYDIKGAEHVTSLHTTSGDLLRLSDSSKKNRTQRR